MFLAENESHIYPNMCAKFGCGPTVVSKGGVVQIYTQTNRQTEKQTNRQTDRHIGTLQLYTVDDCTFTFQMHYELLSINC